MLLMPPAWLPIACSSHRDTARQFTASLAVNVAPDALHTLESRSQGRSIFCENVLVFPLSTVNFEKLTGLQKKPELSLPLNKKPPLNPSRTC